MSIFSNYVNKQISAYINKEIDELREIIDQTEISDNIEKTNIDKTCIYTEQIESFLALESVTNGDLRKIINQITVNREGEIKIYFRNFSESMIS